MWPLAGSNLFATPGQYLCCFSLSHLINHHAAIQSFMLLVSSCEGAVFSHKFTHGGFFKVPVAGWDLKG